MNYSLAEIAAQARKATRGAGYAWGLADEAGIAVRWLEARGLPGTEALAGLLTHQDGCDYAELRPASLDGVWRCASGALCPIIAGITLSDYRFDPPPTLGTVRFPILLIPFLASCGLSHPIVADASLNAEADLSNSPLQPGPLDLPQPQAVSRPIDASVWMTLDRFAHRTYVPASEASRAGAGAGATDND